MKVMKRSLLLFSTILSCWVAQAQQESVFTQYFNNMQAVNPAYVGSRGTFTVTGLHRSQWTGIEDAQRTQTLTMNTPVYNENFGLGLAILNDQIGPIGSTIMNVDLAGRIRVSQDAYLSAGIKIGLNFFRANISGLDLNNPTDPNFSQNVSSTLPNIGAGLYYYTSKYYVGVSIPRIVNNQLANGDLVLGEGRERRHYYFTAGARFRLSEEWDMQPMALVYFPERAPTTFNVSDMFIFNDKLWLGAGWRWKESIHFAVGYNLLPELRAMYSYDFLIGDLQPYSNGSHEISLTYDLPFSSDRIQNPRYF